MRDVAVLGIGQTKFGELWDRSFREIGIEAGLQSLVDAKLSLGRPGAPSSSATWRAGRCSNRSTSPR